ncbi:cell division protein ZapD [Chromatiaceae bacterium AAb-1]|nr:cell division protein ZapD [Chromatiaceae bacterium AAb-1]
MTDIVYEHPLNEKVRTYLRIEHLFAQIEQLLSLDTEWQQQAFFSSLFALTEILDRNDIRPDLIKDVERCETALVAWSKHPSVSDSKLQSLLQQAVRLQSELLRGTKFGSSLKEDKFLSPVRQRFNMAGGTCYFDLPQLQYWFNQPMALRQEAVQQWLAQITLAEQAIRFVLRFARERGHFSPLVAENGFYQNNTEQYELLRIKYQHSEAVYPMVSGNKYRYAIRFMQLNDDNGRSASSKAIVFQLACC